MLGPANRFMLVDALRPPPGSRLDIAVATTFTLDLDALLLATVSFAVFDRLEADDGRPDPIAVLESVRRHADNITIFAQAGAMWGPRNLPPVLAYLEDSVIPVKPSRPGHLFHPKVWALRFVDDDGRLSYRLLVLSRNLTLDSSWDTILRLDGTPTDQPRKNIAVVSDFLRSLPALALMSPQPARVAGLNQLAAELAHVRWESPDDVRWVRFHPLGPGRPTPAIDGERILVVSPFLTEETVRRFGTAPGPNVLISRAAALDRLGTSAVSGFAETLVLDTAVEPPPSPSVHDQSTDGSGAGDNDGEDRDDRHAEETDFDVEPPRPGVEQSGLHAKVYVTEREHRTTLWLGSANATRAAFNGNVEFMVELGFNRSEWTIDRFLDDGGGRSLRSLLVEYRPTSFEPQAPTAVEEATRRLDGLVRRLATASYRVHVTANDDDTFRLSMSWDRAPDGIGDQGVDGSGNGLGRPRIIIGPATQAAFRVPFDQQRAVLESVTLEAITSFLAIEARTRVDGQEVVARTLVNARLSGAPEDRKERILASTLDNPDKVLRYLLFLLAELTGDSALLDALGGGSAAGFNWRATDDTPPLLETLLRTLARNPGALDRVDGLVSDLASTGNHHLLPEDFASVWEPIRAARERIS